MVMEPRKESLDLSKWIRNIKRQKNVVIVNVSKYSRIIRKIKIKYFLFFIKIEILRNDNINHIL